MKKSHVVLYAILFTLSFLMPVSALLAQDQYLVIPIRKEINPTATRMINKGLQNARDIDAAVIIIDMNTYGGLVNDADSIRSAILNSKIPVWVFINKNAASAGALISLACDSIFMQSGANIGAATAVTQEGAKAPDKYQSYMRGLMRSTAESQGKNDRGEYRRNPKIAEAMVDEDIEIKGVSKKGEVVTLTTNEALQLGFCDAKYESLQELLTANNMQEWKAVVIEESFIDKLIGWLLNPAVRGILITGIILGLYFEIQTPGLGIPSIAAILAAVLYFAPAYIEGLAANWEIIIFCIGLVLIALEFLVIPGFGVAGIAGISLSFIGLVLAMVRNFNFDFSLVATTDIFTSLATILIIFIGFIGYLLFQSRQGERKLIFHRLVHNEDLSAAHLGDSPEELKSLIGQMGIVERTCRPIGKVRMKNKVYSASSLDGVKPIGTEITIVDYSQNMLIIK